MGKACALTLTLSHREREPIEWAENAVMYLGWGAFKFTEMTSLLPTDSSPLQGTDRVG